MDHRVLSRQEAELLKFRADNAPNSAFSPEERRTIADAVESGVAVTHFRGMLFEIIDKGDEVFVKPYGKALAPCGYMEKRKLRDIREQPVA